MISRRFLDIFTLFLLVFSGVALLVAAFSVHSTFAIVVAQRARENALLRALGASRRQVTAATLVEASVVAVAASAAGLVGGIGIAAGLQALFPAIGFPFPESELVISGLSMLLPLAVGVLVCLGSALLPAVRAGRTAPLAALRETAVDHFGASRIRAVLAALSVGTTLAGVLTTPSLWLAGAGATLALVAFVVLGPVASSTAVRLLGASLDGLRGVTGGLARRSPRRTAATASALMTVSPSSPCSPSSPPRSRRPWTRRSPGPSRATSPSAPPVSARAAAASARSSPPPSPRGRASRTPSGSAAGLPKWLDIRRAIAPE